MAHPLLEPVAAGQTRFQLPGLVADPRGVAVGREAAVVFATLDRVVSFLGAYSEEASLDELLGSLTLERVQRVGGGHALLLRCGVGDTSSLDRLKRLVGAARGELYTGQGSLFVRPRDAAAPLGWDLSEPIMVGADEFVAVELDRAVRYSCEAPIDPVELILRLQLRHTSLAPNWYEEAATHGVGEMLLVLAAPGLVERVVAYLWRNECTLAALHIVLDGDVRASALLRIRNPPRRLLQTLAGMPGVELFAPISARVAVELGYRHPIHLASATQSLPGDELFLFRGGVGRVERLPGPPKFIDGRHLVPAGGETALAEAATVDESEPSRLQITLQLHPKAAPSEARAMLVAWEQADHLRRLVYLLPQASLSRSRIVLLPKGILVITDSTLQRRSGGAALGGLIPLGQRLCETAPGVLVPDGYELRPKVRPTLVRQLLGLENTDHAVFLGVDQMPVRIPKERLLPMDVALVSRLQLDVADAIPASLDGDGPGVIAYERLGRFALWGFDAASAGGSSPAVDTSEAIGAGTESGDDA